MVNADFVPLGDNGGFAAVVSLQSAVFRKRTTPSNCLSPAQRPADSGIPTNIPPKVSHCAMQNRRFAKFRFQASGATVGRIGEVCCRMATAAKPQLSVFSWQGAGNAETRDASRQLAGVRGQERRKQELIGAAGGRKGRNKGRFAAVGRSQWAGTAEWAGGSERSWSISRADGKKVDSLQLAVWRNRRNNGLRSGNE